VTAASLPNAQAPSVTFVVIAYNESLGIVNCLNSVLAQRGGYSYKVIVVDDGSTDGTGDLVRRTFGERVDVITQENLGRGAARMTGLKAVKTELVAMVDSDIILPADWLQRCTEYMGPASAVGGIADPDGDCSTIQRIFALTSKLKQGSTAITGNNSLFITEHLLSLGDSWMTPLGEDFRLTQLLFARGRIVKTVPGLVVRHVEHKTYLQSLKWLYKSGEDATKLLFEFRIFRKPDLVFLSFLFLLVAASAGVSTFGILVFIPLLAFLGLIGFAHLYSKFEFSTRPFGFLMGAIPNSILMAAYLLGRTIGLLQSLFSLLSRPERVAKKRELTP